MKFQKLKVENFKPYFGEVDIPLFDRSKENKPMTVNVGWNGYGKTSISEAIKWCLHGENADFGPDWEEFVNEYSIDLSDQAGEEETKIGVELFVEIEGKIYRIIRTGTYNLEREKKEKSSNIRILQEGEPIEEDPQSFINNHFHSANLMRYFIFDADNMRETFTENRERTIKESIDRIVGVEDLDSSITALEKVPDLYNKSIDRIQTSLPGDVSKKLDNKINERNRKKDSISKLKEKIDELEEERESLLSEEESDKAERFTNLTERREELEGMLKDLNEDLLSDSIRGESLVSQIFLIPLRKVLKSVEGEIEEKGPTKRNFNRAMETIRKTLEPNYLGIVFSENGPKLLEEPNEIGSESFVEFDNLELREGGGIESSIRNEILDGEERSDEILETFSEYKNKLDKMENEYLEVNNQIKQMGETEKNRELKDKFQKFEKIGEKIERKKDNKADIEKSLEKLEKEIEELREKQKVKGEKEEEMENLKKRKKLSEHILESYREIKKVFLDDFLSSINENASELFRNMLPEGERERFHSIEVDPKYEFHLLSKNGEELSERRTNQATMQVALMSYFISLSQYLGGEVPYVIDAMLIRMDPKIVKKLVMNLGERTDQLIMHMIPETEYRENTFKWLKPYLNTQNYIYRDYTSYAVPVSDIETHPPEKVIEYGEEV